MLSENVSVVIPCYNQGRFLGQALESAVTQTAAPCEIIVVDDGSTDDTAEVAGRYPGVLCLRQPNQGLGAARNTGLHKAQGNLVVFLDADDRLLPQALAAGIQTLLSRPGCGLAAGRYRNIAADGRPLSEGPPTIQESDHYSALLRRNCIGMHGAVMYRRDLLLHSGGFRTDLPACEDYEVYLRLARERPFAMHGQIVAEYRQHSHNMSSDPAVMLACALTVLKEQRDRAWAPHHREAWAAGRQFWQELFGEPLLRRFRRSLRTRSWKRAAADLSVLMRYHPRGLLRSFPYRLFPRQAL